MSAFLFNCDLSWPYNKHSSDTSPLFIKMQEVQEEKRDRKRKKGQYGLLEYTYTGAIINEIYTVNERNDVFTSYTIMLELNIVLIEAQQLLRVCLNCYHKILCFLLHKLYCMII